MRCPYIIDLNVFLQTPPVFDSEVDGQFTSSYCSYHSWRLLSLRQVFAFSLMALLTLLSPHRRFPHLPSPPRFLSLQCQLGGAHECELGLCLKKF